MIATLNIHDQEAYDRYQNAFMPVFNRYGGRLLAADPKPRVMEGESAVMALFSAELEKLQGEGREPSEKMRQQMEKVRAKYEHELEATFAAARGFVDAILTPEESRIALAMALSSALNNPGPHLGVPVLPQSRPGP